MGTLLLLPLLFIVIAVVVGAFIIQVATRMVAGFSPRFGTCVLTAIAGTIAAVVLSWVLQAVLGSGATSSLLGLVAAFLVNSFVINTLVKKPDGAQMGFGKAALVSLVEYVIQIILGVILVLVFGAALIGGISAMSH
jgi:hypothetical protein